MRAVAAIARQLAEDEQAILALEAVHRSHEREFDLDKGRDGRTASYTVNARVVCLLNTILRLLKCWDASGAAILLRPLSEALLLSMYFRFSGTLGDNECEISKWFQDDYTPPAKVLRDYVSRKMHASRKMREMLGEAFADADPHKLLSDKLFELNQFYSKFVHHTRESIMKHSYKGYVASNFSSRLGFEYRRCTMVGVYWATVEVFEKLLLEAVIVFNQCFADVTTGEEHDTLVRLWKRYLDATIRVDRLREFVAAHFGDRGNPGPAASGFSEETE